MSLQLPIKPMLLGLLVGLSYACAEDDDGGLFDGVSDLRISNACEDYCDQARTCSDDVDVDECRANCEDNMHDCMADEQKQAVEDVEDCSAEACNEFLGCTIGAGLQCSFGI